MQLAGVKPGMSVADVGAGEGYYTVRLARVVGAKGRVLAEDIVPRSPRPLSDRVQRERLDNVAVKLGTADNPMLPVSVIRPLFLVHMYHEVQSPYAFLWHLREGVKPDGLVVVVEFEPAGQAARHAAGGAQMRVRGARACSRSRQRCSRPGGYLMAFRVAAPRPAPDKIKPAARAGLAAKGSPAAGGWCSRSPPNTRWSSTVQSSASAASRAAASPGSRCRSDGHRRSDGYGRVRSRRCRASRHRR